MPFSEKENVDVQKAIQEIQRKNAQVRKFMSFYVNIPETVTMYNS